MVERKGIKEIIADSFFELMEQKPICKISINEIAENAGVSRRTFYNNFLDKHELVDWIHWKINVEAGQRASKNATWKEQRINTLTLFYEKKTFYIRAYREPEYTVNFKEISSAMYKAIIRRYVNIDESMNFVLDFYAAGCASLIEDWVRSGLKKSPEEIAVLFELCLPKRLNEILNQNEKDEKPENIQERSEDKKSFKCPYWVSLTGLKIS